MDEDPRLVADAARQACIAAALAAYEEAGVLGLCHEGRWEAAVSAMQSLDMKHIAAPAGRAAAPDKMPHVKD